MADRGLQRELEERIDRLGYELVEFERAGSRARPQLRLRIDRPDAGPDESVTLDECARVSRALEEHLDQREDLSSRYVLEVSSPGVERPLLRPRDWRRFTGKRVAVKGDAPLAGRGRTLQGELIELRGEDDGPEPQTVVLRLDGGEEAEVPLTEISRANLVFDWKKK